MNRLLGFLLLLTFATAVGCQQAEKVTYANVKGKVTYNGQPIEKGQITFAVEGRPPTTMDIVDGKFSGQAMVGSNKISIVAKKKIGTQPKLNKDAQTQIEGYSKYRRDPSGATGPPPEYDPSMVDFIPPEWGAQSKQMRVVEAGAANDFEFDIRGK
jgi:hypothetical protein